MLWWWFAFLGTVFAGGAALAWVLSDQMQALWFLVLESNDGFEDWTWETAFDLPLQKPGAPCQRVATAAKEQPNQVALEWRPPAPIELSPEVQAELEAASGEKAAKDRHFDVCDRLFRTPKLQKGEHMAALERALQRPVSSELCRRLVEAYAEETFLPPAPGTYRTSAARNWAKEAVIFCTLATGKPEGSWPVPNSRDAWVELVGRWFVEYMIGKTESQFGDIMRNVGVIWSHDESFDARFVSKQLPAGTVMMLYDRDKGCFAYWADYQVPFEQLEVSARKYVTSYGCAWLYVRMDVELEAAKAEQEAAKASGRCGGVVRVGTRIVQPQQPQSKRGPVKKHMNRYVREGKICDFKPLQSHVYRVERNISFAEWQSMHAKTMETAKQTQMEFYNREFVEPDYVCTHVQELHEMFSNLPKGETFAPPSATD